MLKNSVSFSSSSRILPLKLSTKAFWIGLPGAMKCQAMLLSWHQASIALQVNSVPLSDTIEPGLPRRATMAVSTRHAGYGMSQTCRAMIECIFGWGKQHGTMRKTKHRGRDRGDFLLNLIGYNLVRIPKLIAA
jgi:hypothetical protein